jgi:hypothetical protein
MVYNLNLLLSKLHNPEGRARFEAGDKNNPLILQGFEVSKIQSPSIQDPRIPCLQRDLGSEGALMHPPRGQQGKTGHIACMIELYMQFHCPRSLAKVGPVKQRQTNVMTRWHRWSTEDS